MLEKVGKYRIVAKIGQGAMGEVYKAHDTVLNRFVAIKTITGSLGSDEQFRQRFHREAQSAASLSHRNIVTVFEFAEDKGMVYMVMELLEGTDLKDLIARGALKRFDDKISVIEQMCDGLAFAHGKGVVHRDLKPANIHVLANGTVKIMDFGLARLGVSEITRTGTVMGTPNYMSPEQVRGEKVDSRSDIFAVGAVMYEVLAGQKPFEAESMHSVLFQVLDQNPEPIRNRTPEIPVPIAEIVDRALAKDPAQRFQGAGEMRAALRNASRVMATGKAASSALESASDAASDHDPTLARSPGSSQRAEPPEWPTEGATALDLAPASRSQAPRTARPHPTMVGSGPTPAARSGWVYAVAAVLVLVIAGAGVFAWLRLRGGAQAIPAAEVAVEQERILRETLIAGKVELAQGQLENKSYAEAITQADQILVADPGNASAREIRSQAQAKLAELEVAAKEARAAFQAGDPDGASQKLTRVMAIDPSHPVVGELSAALDRQFRGQVEEARLAARKTRGDAEKAKAQSYDGFAAADRGVAEGERLLQGNQFVQATQKFLEARDGFARARRAAEAAEAAALKAAAAPSAAPSLAARPFASPGQAPSASVPPPVTVLPSIAPPTNSPITAPGLSAPTTAAPADAAIQKLLADYAHAIETKDLALFRTVKPGLSGDEEKGLRDFFKNSGAYKVGLTIESVKVEGGQATVLVSRADTAGGKPMKPYRQSFRLGQKGGSWFIQSIGT